MISPLFAAMSPAGYALLAAGRGRGMDSGQIIMWLVVAVVGMAIVCGGVYAGTRASQRWKTDSHLALVYGLSRVHGLDRRARGLVRQVAKVHHLSSPARVFTEPNWLAPDSLKGPLQSRSTEIAALRSRIFSEASG